MVQLFQTLVRTAAPGMSFADLLAALFRRSEAAELQKQSVVNIAKCIAGICEVAEPAAREETVALLAGHLSAENNRAKHSALLALGEK